MNRTIRADFDRESIVVYQAYDDDIADAALAAGRFVAPFSFTRMTWIKPSFLWLMERSNWAKKSGQRRILAVRITREGWERALSLAVLTSYEPRMHASREQWRNDLDEAHVLVQWDPERSTRGARLDVDAIQVGVSRHVIRELADSWTRAIVDVTPLVRKMRKHIDDGDVARASALLPREREYAVGAPLQQRLGMR